MDEMIQWGVVHYPSNNYDKYKVFISSSQGLNLISYLENNFNIDSKDLHEKYLQFMDKTYIFLSQYGYTKYNGFGDYFGAYDFKFDKKQITSTQKIVLAKILIHIRFGEFLTYLKNNYGLNENMCLDINENSIINTYMNYKLMGINEISAAYDFGYCDDQIYFKLLIDGMDSIEGIKLLFPKISIEEASKMYKYAVIDELKKYINVENSSLEQLSVTQEGYENPLLYKNIILTMETFLSTIFVTNNSKK